MRALAVLAVLLVACAPAVTSPSASPTPAAIATVTSAPSATVTLAPSPSPTRPSVSIVPSTPIPLPSFAGISAPSSNAVWVSVAGTHLFLSSDRGNTWEQRSLLPPPAISSEIAFIDEREGWLVTPGQPGTQCTFQAVSIQHTIDAAATWQPLTVSGLDGMGCKRGARFVGAKRGFISASDQEHPPVVYRTTDGGSTWTASAPFPDPPGFVTRGAGATLQAGGISAFGAVLLVEATGTTSGSPRRYVFRSADGGASWTYAATLPEGAAPVTFVTASRWLEIQGPGQSQETTDAGVTWHAYASDYQQAAPVPPYIVFADPQVGYATVRGTLQRTVDGGAHWSGLHTPGTP